MLFGVPPFWSRPPEAKAATQDTWFTPAAGTYKYRKKLTLDNTLVSGSTDLTNFPALVAFTDADLKVTGSGGDVTNSSGYDIIFTSSAATPTQLDHEIEKYTSTTGEIVMWVEVPTLGATADTDIYMYYGNSSISSSQEAATGVWDGNFKGVWHLKENPSGTAPQMKDSTSNVNNGTMNGGMNSGQQVAGQIAGSLDFQVGVGEYVNVGSGSSLNISGAATICLWTKLTSLPANASYVVFVGNNSTDSTTAQYHVALENRTSTYYWSLGWDGSSQFKTYENALTTATATWYHFCSVRVSDSSVQQYRNGTAAAAPTASGIATTPTTGVGSTAIGRGGNADSNYVNGIIDEVRISNVARSADWIKTEYDNQANQGTGTGKFIKTAGSEEGYVTSTASVDTRWVKGGATGQNFAITVNNSTNSAVSAQWVQITRPSTNYTITAGSATGWSAAVTASTATFTGSTIAANASTAFTVTATIGSSDEAQTAWTVDLDDGTDGSSATTSVATSTTALYSGIDATGPTVTMSGVTVDTTSQLTATANAATDASSGLHASAPYWFDETSGGSGATDSTAWQSAVTFADTGLSAGTQYCYRVKARDAVLNESAYTSTSCGTTTGSADGGGSSGVPAIQSAGGSAPALPPLEVSDIVADAGVDAAVITFITTRPATSYIEYGSTTAYGAATFKSTDTFQKHGITLSKLNPGAGYHFRVITEDSQGKIVKSDDLTFTTHRVPPPGTTLLQQKELEAKEAKEQAATVEAQKKEETARAEKKKSAPVITGVSIVAVRPTSAKIAWQTSIPATSQILFGERSKDLNQVTIEYATLVTEHAVTISDLKPKTAYYFTAVSRGEGGAETVSPEASFTTESLEIQTVVDVAKPVPLPPGSPGTQTPKIAAGETVTIIPILPTPGDTAGPDVVLLSFAKNPTQEASPLIRGSARDARGVIAAVAYSTDGGATWHPIDNIQGMGSSAAQFSARIPHLQEGEYGIVFRARDNSGNIGKSEARSLVIDIKPPKTGANTFALGTQITMPSAQGVLTTLVGITQRIMLSAIGGATAVQVTAGDASFPLTYSKTDNLWFGDITLKSPGTYRLAVEAVDGAGRTSQRPINTVEVAAPGKVTDSATGGPLAGAKVSLYSFSRELNNFVLWPGDIFNQANPAVTGEDGVYRFLVPVGRYYIKAEKEGYKALYTQIRDFPNHSVLNFTMPLRQSAVLSFRLPLVLGGRITLPGLPDFLGHTRISASSDIVKSAGGGEVASLIGALAPSFSLSDSAGRPVDVRYLRGKKTVLTAWATWAPLAQVQVPIMDQLVKEDPENVSVLLLSSQESKGVVETYLRRGNYDLQSVIDPDGDLLDLYGITTLPQHFFLDRKGIIRRVHTGFVKKEALQQMLREIP